MLRVSYLFEQAFIICVLLGVMCSVQIQAISLRCPFLIVLTPLTRLIVLKQETILSLSIFGSWCYLQLSLLEFMRFWLSSLALKLQSFHYHAELIQLWEVSGLVRIRTSLDLLTADIITTSDKLFTM